MSSPDAAPGVQFSEEKGTSDKRIAPLSVGEGILPPAKNSPLPDDKTGQHLDKANSLLDELSREERSGFKAEIGGIGGASMGSSNFDHSGGAKTKSLKHKKSTSDIEEDNYDDDFIDEDIAGDDRDDIDESGNLQANHKIGDSHGITVSQSLGIDPSVDSLALEEYDHIEPVDKMGESNN
jgi:hypothetical protein